MENLQVARNFTSTGEFTEYVDVTNEETPVMEMKKKHFIEANTTAVELKHLKNECITPVFSKDNELTISHPIFVETAYEAAQRLFPNEHFDTPDIMVSHLVKGRTPEAMHKPNNQLLKTDETIYYERMAFAFEIPSIYTDIAGNRINLCITGVRAYNRENLFSKKSPEKFSIAIGFRNTVCCNLCTFTDGYQSDIRVMNQQDLLREIMNLFSQYNADKHLHLMNDFQKYSISEHEFAQFLGKSRLYQCLPAKEKKLLPALEITDSQINTIAKNYYQDENFAMKKGAGRISMWNVYNLLTGAVKSSYADNFLDRSLNATEVTSGLCKVLQGDSEYEWFLE